MIEIKNLKKSYGRFEALKGIDIFLDEGEIYILLGSNGAGKTTLIKILTGLLSPSSGTAKINGKSARNIKDIRAKFGYMPEHPDLYERLTGEEFLHMMGSLKGVEEDRLVEKIHKLSQELEIERDLNKEIGSYSKGMKQKILFINAVINDPPNLILDEPTNSLDPRFSQDIKSRIKDLSSRGKCILMSTHITPVAEDIADRVGIIEKGRLVAEGTVSELKRETDSDNLEQVFIEVVNHA
ncbi:MAG: ABC transporter ATP-binding protein [Candidatus Thermoplasmatota archaeon]|nr:ABC transporter ATP-binding protein [Candidatus Thermoplasmatota archaeon]MBS3790574.1 ABC transporter ATP-binding protein [Candidatus Thermoplasmatota archaeon]